VGGKSEGSPYGGDFATFGEDVVYNQRDAEDFIRLDTLRLRIPKLLSR